LAANGKLIANIDADTMLATGWLDIALAEFEKTPRLVALSGPFIHYDMPKQVRLIAAGFYRVALAGSFLVKLVAGTGVMMQGGNFIVQKSALAASNAFNADFSFYGEDTALARCLGMIGEVKFSFALRAYSSGRRLAGEGVLKVGSRYLLNYLSTMVFNRPFTETWLDFRPPNGENKGI
jgi:cellulose synthase/poly-beta-1,6-N-acetylglucosamine synthase-like glycosyltransferase